MRLFAISMLTAMLAGTIGVSDVSAGDPGLFRTRLADAPSQGVLRMSNTSFYSAIPLNTILKNSYRVSDPHIYSSIFEFEMGVTDFITVEGSLPYYRDLFKQEGREGSKTGAGDVVLGVRFSRNIQESLISGLSIGSRVRIPEQLGYGPEPLGFRTFSYGEMAYSVDVAAGFRLSRMDMNISVSVLNFSADTKADSAFVTDAFYDTGFGYLGIGRPDASGLAKGLFQNQLHTSVGLSMPVKSWMSMLLEFNTTAFLDTPSRDTIITLAPAVRFGSPEGLNMSLGIDYALSGPVPDKTFLFRFRVPTLSYRGIKALLTQRKIDEAVRSRNARVAVTNITKQDMSYIYEQDLKNALFGTLTDDGYLGIVSRDRVDNVMFQQSLVPIREKPQQLGVRIGANYLINTEIIEYQVDRLSNFTIPYLIGFPQTDFNLSCRVSITDLVTGDEHPLGIVTAQVVRTRGVAFFPSGPSADIDYLSAPERRKAEKELINNWIMSFNDVLIENSGIFGWAPRRAEVSGDVGKAQ